MTGLILMAALTEAIHPGHVIWTCPDVNQEAPAVYVELMLPNDGARMVENGERIVDGKPFGNVEVLRVGKESLTLKNKAGKVYELPLKNITKVKLTKPGPTEKE